MSKLRTLAIVAFASVGLNVFLGGVLAGKSMRGQPPPPHGLTHQSHDSNGKPPHHGTSQELERGPAARGPKAQKHLAHKGRHRDPDGSAEGGPSDLALLRQMVRIMGGPRDPRIADLREARKDEIRRIRTEMQAAHKRVHESLTADKPDDVELREALKNLRKTAFEAQARAQEGILTLASLMTPEERAQLRDQSAAKKSGRQKGPAGQDEKKP